MGLTFVGAIVLAVVGAIWAVVGAIGFTVVSGVLFLFVGTTSRGTVAVSPRGIWVRSSSQVGDEPAQCWMKSMNEIRNSLEIVSVHVTLHSSRANRVAHLVQRTTGEDQEVGKFGMGAAAEPFRNVPTDRVDRVVCLSLRFEVPSELRSCREREDLRS